LSVYGGSSVGVTVTGYRCAVAVRLSRIAVNMARKRFIVLGFSS
jgi:hypothetical protein